MDPSVAPDTCERPSKPSVPAHPYYVRIEYPAVAYTTIEIEAESPEAAVERARRLHDGGGLPFDLDHTTHRERRSFFVSDAEEENGEPFLIRRDRRDRLAGAAEHLIDALKHLVTYAVSRVEELHDAADRTGDPDDIAAWLHADQATTIARRWIERLR